MQFPLVTQDGSKKEIELSEGVFGCQYNEPLIHQIVTAYLAGARQGTHAQKNRSAVSGGGKKPWKQKGSGRARAGTIRSPLWRKGGVTFAAQTQNYSQKVNKKMYRAAMRSIFSELIRQERLLVVEEFLLDKPKTQVLLQKLKDMQLEKTLILLEEVDLSIFLASRNIVGVDVCDVEAINPVDLINFDKVLVTVPALKQIEELLT